MESGITDVSKPGNAPTTTRYLGAGSNLNWNHEFRYDDSEVKNSNWYNGHPSKSYANGMSNEEFWALIRRFNKHIFRVKRIGEQPLSQLDMYISTEEDITEEKLRAHAERLYTSVIFDIFSVHKHIVRLRSWREQYRTIWFLGAYSVAWLADLLSVTLLIFLMVLIIYPPSREKFFPSAPASITSGRTGAVKKPMAGVLASDSVTGAPEHHKGETVEQEARSFLNSLSAVSLYSLQLLPTLRSERRLTLLT